jgi:plastocyanin
LADRTNGGFIVLHTRATALRHSRNGTRGSRNLFVTVCGAAMLAALAACGSDNTTSPNGVLATITVTPANPTVAAGDTVRFTAVGKDANGNVVSIDPSWSLVGVPGTMSGDGLFTAGSTTGSFANGIKATSGNVSGTTSVTVGAAGADVVGNYSLTSVDGKAPPDTVVHTSTTTVVFTDGTLALNSDATYKLLFHSSTTTSSGTAADSSGSTGTYSVNGNTVTIRNTSTGDSVIATATLPSLTFTDGGQVFVFTK